MPSEIWQNIVLAIESIMNQIVVPDLDDELKNRLQKRADRYGRSLEEEAKEILRVALEEEPLEPSNLGRSRDVLPLLEILNYRRFLENPCANPLSLKYDFGFWILDFGLVRSPPCRGEWPLGLRV